MYALLPIFERIDIYEMFIRDEMRKLGATREEFNLLTYNIIENNFKKRRSPEDVAWAILQ